MNSAIINFILNAGRLLFYGLSFLNLGGYRYPPDAKKKNGTTFDYIVVGAGSAGSVIATRLTEDPNVSVLLVEAGKDPQLESNLPGLAVFASRSYMDWNYYSSNKCLECKKDGAIELTRGKALGGSSSSNFMFYVRGHPHNYETWALKANDSQWKYENILPYFIKSERLKAPNVLNTTQAVFHGTDGYLGVTKPHFDVATDLLSALKEVGYDLVVDCNGNDTLGFAETEVTVADNMRQSTANAFLSKVKHRKNLHVLKKTLVTKILINKNKEAEGIEALDEQDRKLIFKARKEVIISAGAINSPQLLMLSGIGPRRHLKSFKIATIVDLPVGKNLQDHWQEIIVIRAKELSLQSPDLSEYPFSTVTGFVSLNKTKRNPDYQTQIFTVNAETFLILCNFASLSNEICDMVMKETKGHTVFAALNGLMESDASGEILLQSTNPKDHPKIYVKPDPEIKSHLETQITYVKDFLRILNSTYFKSINAELISLKKCDHFVLGSDDYLRCYMKCMYTTFWHYTGTCAMGTVVDSRLRVFGVRKLRVADASIMPTIPSGNTNAPTIMIGEKAADMIKEDNKS